MNFEEYVEYLISDGLTRDEAEQFAADVFYEVFGEEE